jgi:hypothetical protein
MRSHLGSQAPDLGICKGSHCARAIADWALARRHLISCAGAAHLHIDTARLNWQCFFTCAAQGIVQDAIAFDPHYYKYLYLNDIFFNSDI